MVIKTPEGVNMNAGKVKSAEGEMADEAGRKP
jgi:hypothetical protein